LFQGDLEKKIALDDEEIASSIKRLTSLVQFPTVSSLGPSNGAYDACAKWILHELEHVVGIWGFILEESKLNKPIVIGIWEGIDTTLPGILLNSHYDVVPVVNEKWTVPAFEGLIQNNRIYGRGTQDMKCVCAQYITALAKLKKTGFEPMRTIFLSFLPDEEIGGGDGMNVLMKSDWFASISVAVALDEGLASEGDDYTVFYGERLPWWVKVKAMGATGHGSRFIEGTAVEQLLAVTDKALKFRQQQRDELFGVGDGSDQHLGCSHAIVKKKGLGDVTSLNVTMLRAGVVAAGDDVINVVPPYAEAGFDIRIAPHVDPQEVSDMLTLWCEEVSTTTKNSLSGDSSGKKDVGVSWEYYYEPVKHHSKTSTDPAENPWWGLFQQALLKHFQINVSTEVFPAATDSRFLRALGIKALGFSPMRRSPVLLHEHDEYIDQDVFIEGCNVYFILIKVLSSQLGGDIDKK